MTSDEKVANHVREGGTSVAAEPRGTGRLRRWVFRLVVMTVVPALLLGLLEGGLRLVGYGYPTSFFVRIRGRADYAANDRFGWRFFPRGLSRSASLIYLPAEKGEHVYRIFILGGSAARGEPGMAFSFGRILEVMLRTRYPETRFEVINTALTAISSHVVLPIARDCARHAPDLFIVCMGNNEVVGPYGAGTILRPYSPSLAMIRAGLWIKTTKIGQLVEAIVSTVRSGGEPKWRGMEMFIEQRVAAADPRLSQVYEHFRENLTDICRVGSAAGAKVILCTVPVNLRNCAPFASEHRPGLPGAELIQWGQAYRAGIRLEAAGDLSRAVAQYLAAEKIDGRFADLHFRLGQCYLGLKRPAEASRHHILARDLDTLRFRADSRINDIIRQVAADRSGAGTVLVDAERAFAQSGQVTAGLPGEELFYEHVHLTFEGNYELARAAFRQVAEVLPDSIRAASGPDTTPPSIARCAELLVLTGWNRYRMARQMWETTARPPFTGQLDHPRRRGRLFGQLRDLEPQIQAPALAAAAAAYGRAIRAAEDDVLLRDIFARLQFSRGDYASVEEHCRALLDRLPDSRVARANLGCALLAQGRMEEANSYLEQSRNPAAEAIGAHHIVAKSLLEQGKVVEAVALYRRALEIDSEHVGTLVKLGQALARQGKAGEALAQFSRAAELHPDDASARGNLGSLLAGLRKPAEGIRHLVEAVRLDPLLTSARLALARALVREGELEEADKHFAWLTRQDPGDPSVLHHRSYVLVRLGRVAEAVAHYEKIVWLQPKQPAARTTLAWLLATTDDPKVRNASRAIQLAREAVGLTQGREVRAFDALAAALAAAGKFPEAIAQASRALQMASDSGETATATQIRQRLELYRAGQPYRLKPARSGPGAASKKAIPFGPGAREGGTRRPVK